MARQPDRFVRIKGDTARRYFDTVTQTIVSDRTVRTLRELAGTRTRLEAEALARQRSQQARYNALIREITRPQLASIDQQIYQTEQLLAEAELDGSITDDVRKSIRKELKAEIARLSKQKRGVKKAAIQDKGIKKARKLLDTAKPGPDGNAQRIEALELLRRRGPGSKFDIPSWVPAGSSDDYMRGKLKKSNIAKWRYSGARTYQEYRSRFAKPNATGRNASRRVKR